MARSVRLPPALRGPPQEVLIRFDPYEAVDPWFPNEFHLRLRVAEEAWEYAITPLPCAGDVRGGREPICWVAAVYKGDPYAPGGDKRYVLGEEGRELRWRLWPAGQEYGLNFPAGPLWPSLEEAVAVIQVHYLDQARRRLRGQR